MSGEHCRVRVDANGGIDIEDLGTNCTYINGARVGKGKRMTAKVGDEIWFHISWIFRE